MKTYAYTLTYTDKYGNYNKVSAATEEQMFVTALAVYEEGGDLSTAYREVYEVSDGYAHFLGTEPYWMGKPQTGKGLNW